MNNKNVRLDNSLEISNIGGNYKHLLSGISSLLEESCKVSVRSVNAILTATYWEIGRRIIEFEQYGEERAQYGERLLSSLAVDLQNRFGRGFTERNLRNMRQFYILWPKFYTTREDMEKRHTKSAELSIFEKRHTACAKLSWSHYRRLLSLESREAREFYEAEALRGGWSVRQLDKQISTQFYKRPLFSKNKIELTRIQK